MAQPTIPDITKIELSDQQLAAGSVLGWISVNEIKNEKGDQIEFYDHPFLIDIFLDTADNLCVVKAAQVGMSTLEILKNHHDAKSNKMDIIYTLPADNDVTLFVGGKVNRIIANNPCMLLDVADKDSIEQKAVGGSMLYFRGTWTKKSAIMITADRLVHDEKDSSKQDVIADYQARLQHSKFKQTHVFSHPSMPNMGVDMEWQKSDQKEWIITCPHCQKKQHLTWNTEDDQQMNVDITNKCFVCKKCKGVLSDDDRRNGRWMARKGKEHAEWSGYHISLLMAPYIKATYIIEKHQEVMEGKQTMDFFYNKVLGLPYAGSGNKVNEDDVMGAWTPERNLDDGRIVVGVDTGKDLRYVVGNRAGLMEYGQKKSYEPDVELGIELKDSLEYYLKKFPNSVMVIDQGGDIIGPRKLRAKYPGRVFLCHYAKDRKTMQLIRWGEKDESGNVIVDRNRMIQLTVDELKERRWRLYNGDRQDWYDYWLHWSHIYRTVEEDSLGRKVWEWHRSDRDDWVHATVYWRIGLGRFGGKGAIQMPSEAPPANSYMVNPDHTVSFNPDDMFSGKQGSTPDDPWWAQEDEGEWR